MASVVQKQTIIGSNLSQNEDGFTDTAFFFVTGLDAVGAEKKYQAITTVGVPQIGDPHPFISGIRVRNIPRVTVHKGGFTAQVEVSYAKPDSEDGDGGGGGGGGGGVPGTVRLGAVYERVPSNFRTNKDGTIGKEIQIVHDFTVPFDGDSLTGSGEKDAQKTMVGEVNAYLPRLTVIKRGNTLKCPLTKAQKTGFTNADNFLAPIAGLFDAPPDGNPDTWLLIRSSANSTDNNESFDFEFEWAYKKETWHEIAVFIDPATGRPPGNIKRPAQILENQKGNGTLVVRVAGQTNFTPYVQLQ